MDEVIQHCLEQKFVKSGIHHFLNSDAALLKPYPQGLESFQPFGNLLSPCVASNLRS